MTFLDSICLFQLPFHLFQSISQFFFSNLNSTDFKAVLVFIWLLWGFFECFSPLLPSNQTIWPEFSACFIAQLWIAWHMVRIRSQGQLMLLKVKTVEETKAAATHLCVKTKSHYFHYNTNEFLWRVKLKAVNLIKVARHLNVQLLHECVSDAGPPEPDLYVT